MARTAVTVTQTGRSYAILQPAYAAADAANGNYCENDGRVFFDLQNTDASSQTVTFHVRPDAIGASDVVVTLAAGQRQLAGPFPPSIYTLSPQVLGTVYISDGFHTGSSPIVPTPGTVNCITFDASSALVNIRAFRL